jgi:hypothetical protein
MRPNNKNCFTIQNNFAPDSHSFNHQLIAELAEILYSHFCVHVSSMANDHLLPQPSQDISSKVGA